MKMMNNSLFLNFFYMELKLESILYFDLSKVYTGTPLNPSFTI